MSSADTTPADWWQTAFGSRYLDVYAHRDAESARREIRALVSLGLRGRVLDVGCGAGRHLLAMRESGLQAFGLDWSTALLARAAAARAGGQAAERIAGADADAPSRAAPSVSRAANSRAQHGLDSSRPLAGRVVRADMRALPFLPHSFDALTCLFNSFGYFDDLSNARVLEQARALLREGGTAFFDLMNAGRLRATLVPASERAVGGFQVSERRRLSAEGTRVEKRVVVVDPEGRSESWVESVRLYEPAEIAAAMRDAGLAIERACGDWDGSEFDARSPRMLVLARRQG